MTENDAQQNDDTEQVEVELIQCGGCERRSLLDDAEKFGRSSKTEIDVPHCPRCGTRVEYEGTVVETFERRSLNPAIDRSEGVDDAE